MGWGCFPHREICCRYSKSCLFSSRLLIRYVPWHHVEFLPKMSSGTHKAKPYLWWPWKRLQKIEKQSVSSLPWAESKSTKVQKPGHSGNCVLPAFFCYIPTLFRLTPCGVWSDLEPVSLFTWTYQPIMEPHERVVVCPLNALWRFLHCGRMSNGSSLTPN